MRAVLATLFFALSFTAVAPAKPASEHHGKSLHRVYVHKQRVTSARHYAHVSKRVRRHFGGDGRPAKWCGWYLRQVFGVTDRAYNRALNWVHWGRSADGPQIGAVVVWRYHVGLIEGGPDEHGRWLVRSGNDGHAVRTRYLSLKGAVAFRMPESHSRCSFPSRVALIRQG
jgi:hypothetical protein